MSVFNLLPRSEDPRLNKSQFKSKKRLHINLCKDKVDIYEIVQCLVELAGRVKHWLPNKCSFWSFNQPAAFLSLLNNKGQKPKGLCPPKWMHGWAMQRRAALAIKTNKCNYWTQQSAYDYERWCVPKPTSLFRHMQEKYNFFCFICHISRLENQTLFC